ncbi:PREDICTED: uncharacterized protein LOC109236068 [Nicotiana attenuata]|uniref:uncharacterized protein LOC109236068 n=1 Tax=Nicotiana attenuata TaxID=49451 RepID=UPI000904D717|nr:PREDICTED: uncharacterized protein LOC109236068 [Nicotiana attenuata]
MNLDSACGGSCMAKPYSEIQLLLNNFTANDHNWQGDGDSRKASKQKAAGLIELDDFSAMRADIAKLANQSRGPMNQNAQYGNTYNLNWKNHPNFSWGGNQPNQNYYRPQGNFNQPQKPPQQVKENGNDLLKQLLLDNQQLRTDFRNSERQMGQLASAQNTRPVGALPSDTKANAKASLNAVSLRNGRQLEEVQPKKSKQVSFEERPATIESTSEKSKESEKPAREAVAEQPPPVVARPPPPFPQRLQKVKDNAAYKKFLDILKQYIKDIVANKRRLTEFETVALTEECSSKIQSKLPQKLKDPSSFTIQISIGKHAVGRALCDLGASINLMPLSVFKQLGLGEPRPTTVVLQLADRSLAHPEGVIEDVLVQVGSFIFPADFIILDYEPDHEVPIYFGASILSHRPSYY